MITEAILGVLLGVVDLVVGFLPEVHSLPSWLQDLMTVIGYGLQLFPQDVWIFSILNISFWTFGLIGWSIIEWVYKKIPGVS